MPNIKGIVLFHLIYEAYKPILTLCVVKMQKNFFNISDKGLIFRIYNECMQVNNKKKQFFKWVENLNTSLYEMYKW